MALLTFPATNGQLAGFNRLAIGGGGFITGLDINGSRKVCSPDVTHGHIKDGDDPWRPLLTAASMPSDAFDPRTNNYGAGLADEEGCYAVRMAPSNNDHILVGWNAFVWRSTDEGQTFTKCNLAAKRMLANSGAQRLWNRKFDIHPTDPLTFIIGTSGDGVYYTTDGGTNFSSVTISAGSTLNSIATPHLVAFDPGAPLNVFISRHGTGIYRSTAGVGGSFTHVSGGPTSARQIHVTSAGTLWVCSVEGALWKLARGSTTWTQPTAPPGSLNVHSFALDPADLNSLVVSDADGILARSTDGGSTWVGSDRWVILYPAPIGIYQNAGDIPWLGDYPGALFPSHMQFDPVASNKLWIAQGLGVSYSNPPTTFTRWDWYDDTSGIEELVFHCGLSIPGNSRPLFGAWDKPLWRPKNLDFFRDGPMFPGGTPTSNAVDHCFDFDYATGAPDKVYAIVNYNHALAGFSEDGGATWEPFAAQHPDGLLIGGCIASTGDNNIIWVPGNNGKAVRSSNGGTSWSYINMGGSSGGIPNWVNAMFVRRHIVTADKERPGYAAIVVNTGSGGDSQGITGGVYRTADHGANWTQRLSGLIDSGADSAQFWHAQLKYIPGKSGELLYTAGRDFTSKLMHSANDGTSFTALRGSEITSVRSFGFGKAASGQTYPVVFFDGTVSGVSGVYRSEDWFATAPELLARWPLDIILNRNFVMGDMNVYGRCYVAPVSNGLLYGNL